MKLLGKVKMRKTGRASLSYVFAAVASRALSFAFIPIYNRILTREELGVYSLYLSWLSLFTVITTLEIHGSVSLRAFSAYAPNRPVLETGIITGGGMILFSLFIYILFSTRINSLTSLGTPLTLLMLLQIFFNLCEGIILGKLRYKTKYKAASLITFLSGLSSSLLALSLLLSGKAPALGRIYAPVFVSAVIIIPILIKIFFDTRKSKKTPFDKEIAKRLVLEAIPLLLYFLFISIIKIDFHL